MKRKNFMLTVAAFCGAMTLCSCHGDVLNDVEEQGAEATSLLHVFTRSAESPTLGENVPTPVSLYVFNASGVCVKVLPDVLDNALVPVQGGTYDIYAIAGADETRYDLPSDDATIKSVVSLKSGQTLGDLMQKHATVTVEDAEERDLEITLKRMVMAVQQITIKKVPAAVTAVSVTVAPLYESLALDGTYSGTEGSYTAELEEGDDGKTWSLKEEDVGAYIFPSAGEPTITVRFTTSEGATTYSYSAPEALEANHKLKIEATYTEEAKLQVTGTITASDWDEDTAISFDFDESKSSGTTPGSGGDSGDGSGDNTGGDDSSGGDQGDEGDEGDDAIVADALPAVGTKFKTCYVLDRDESTNEVTLLAPKSEKNFLTSQDDSNSASTKAQDILDSWDVEGIKGWEIPSRSVAELIVSHDEDINTKVGIAIRYNVSSSDYLFKDTDGTVKSFKSLAGSFNVPNTIFTANTTAIGVKKVKLTINP